MARASATLLSFGHVCRPCFGRGINWETKRKAPPPQPAGIPQGLPISAVLANVYMLETDLAIAAAVRLLGGTYRRYSDDILVLAPVGQARAAEKIVREELARVRLTVNAAKTERCRFRKVNGVMASIDDVGKESFRSPASYLGMSFDGVAIRVRHSTLARFLAKARRAITRAEIAARLRGERLIKRRQLYARLTSLGYGRAYGAYSGMTGRPKNAPRLGFFKYLELAEHTTGSRAIAKQRRQVENRVFRWLSDADRNLRST